MNNLVENKFGHGGAVDKVDERDYQFSATAQAQSLFDWNAGFDIEAILGIKIPVKNQGTSGSCGGQAWSYYGAVLEALATGTFEERSAKFLYSQTYVPPAGSYGRPLCDIAVNQGWAYESMLPSYENGMPPSEEFMQRVQDITPEVRTNASSAKALRYYNVTNDIESVARAIQAGNGCILGVEGENNGTWLSPNPLPPNKVEWRHWVYAGKVRLFNGKKQIGILNSWDKTTGEQGWQWLGEEYFTGTRVFQVWVLLYNPQIPFKHNFTRDILMRESSSEVTALQTALKEEGLFNINPTGYYGTITQQAVKAFQQKYKVTSWVELVLVNGKRVGSKTRVKLNQIYNK